MACSVELNLVCENLIQAISIGNVLSPLHFQTEVTPVLQRTKQAWEAIKC